MEYLQSPEYDHIQKVLYQSYSYCLSTTVEKAYHMKCLLSGDDKHMVWRKNACMESPAKNNDYDWLRHRSCNLLASCDALEEVPL